MKDQYRVVRVREFHQNDLEAERTGVGPLFDTRTVANAYRDYEKIKDRFDKRKEGGEIPSTVTFVIETRRLGEWKEV